MRSCRLIGSDRKVRLMRRPRAGLVTPAPGRPWPAVRRHYDRLPAVLRNDGLHAAATKERWPPLRIGGLNTGLVAARKYGPKGLQERRKWSAGRRLVPIARDEETPRKRLIGRLRQPLREPRKLPRFPALRSPWGAEVWNSQEGLPGADQRARAMSHAYESWNDSTQKWPGSGPAIVLICKSGRRAQIDSPSPSITAYCVMPGTRCQPLPLK